MNRNNNDNAGSGAQNQPIKVNIGPGYQPGVATDRKSAGESQQNLSKKRDLSSNSNKVSVHHAQTSDLSKKSGKEA